MRDFTMRYAVLDRFDHYPALADLSAALGVKQHLDPRPLADAGEIECADDWEPFDVDLGGEA